MPGRFIFGMARSESSLYFRLMKGTDFGIFEWVRETMFSVLPENNPVLSTRCGTQACSKIYIQQTKTLSL